MGCGAPLPASGATAAPPPSASPERPRPPDLVPWAEPAPPAPPKVFIDAAPKARVEPPPLPPPAPAPLPPLVPLWMVVAGVWGLIALLVVLVLSK